MTNGRNNSSTSYSEIASDLDRDEGRRGRPYKDTVGMWTIGVGHNLNAAPLCDAAIDAQLAYDIGIAERALDRKYPWWRACPDPVKRVLVNLQFNLGSRFDWPVTMELIRLGHYKAAAQAIRDNHIYTRQVGPRAERLARLLESVV